MGSLLIILIAITVSSLIGYTIGRQRQAIELDEALQLADARLETIQRKVWEIEYLNAENEHWQGRVRRLEEHLVAGAHLNSIPPRVMRSKDIDPAIVGKLDSLPQISAEAEAFGLSTVKTKEVIKSLGPKEPPTPLNHKEVG